jgi:hypothetical protein
MAPKLTRAEQERHRLERVLVDKTRAGARKTEDATYCQNQVVLARDRLAKNRRSLMQEAQDLASCRQVEVDTAQAELEKAVLVVEKLAGYNSRQEMAVQEAELASMAANREARVAAEDREETNKLVKAACELSRGARLESVGSEASSWSQDLDQDEELKKRMLADKRTILRLNRGVRKMELELGQSRSRASGSSQVWFSNGVV